MNKENYLSHYVFKISANTMTCGNVTNGKNNGIFHDAVASFRIMISV